ATSFIDGRQKIFSKGSIVEAITASCAIPTIFPALELECIPYVDGALSNNLPVEPFLLKKKNVISVHVNPIRDLSEKRVMMEIIEVGYRYGLQYLLENPHLLTNKTFIEKLKQRWRSSATQNP